MLRLVWRHVCYYIITFLYLILLYSLPSTPGGGINIVEWFVIIGGIVAVGYMIYYEFKQMRMGGSCHKRKADKTDVKDVKSSVQEVKADVKSVIEKLDQKADTSSTLDVKSDLNALLAEVRYYGTRLDRIETGIKTLQWTMTAGLAVLGIILAFMKAC